MSSNAPPSWIATLATGSIAADMIAADDNGIVSETGLATLLADLAATLSASATLTAVEFGDLKIIAANLENGLSTSDYLDYVFNALVNGTQANATWTGGAASSTALGNLAIGATATQLNQLTGKWLLGTDLPSSAISKTTVSYSPVSAPLFGAGGPSVNDVNQGQIGDCWLLAACAEIATQNPSLLSAIFTDNGNNTYGVRFYIDGAAEYVTINSDLANGGTYLNSGPNTWASMLEKAFAQAQTAGLTTGNDFVTDGNSYVTIGSSGWPDNALEALTGCSSFTDFTASGNGWTAQTEDASLATTATLHDQTSATVKQAIISGLAAHDDIIVTSYTSAIDSSGNNTLITNHDFAVYGYNATSDTLQLRNPWGVQTTQFWDTTFDISLSTLLAAGDVISIDNAGTSPANPAIPSGAISETAAYVSANIASLQANPAILAISLSDSGIPAVTLTGDQATNNAESLSKITNQLYEIIADGAPAYHAGGNGLANPAIRFTASKATIAINPDSRVNVTGSGDVVTAAASANFSVYGKGGDTIAAAAGDNAWIGDNGANGANVIVHGSNILAHLSNNSRMDVAGANNTITALASSNLGVWGGGDVITAASGDNIWLGGNGSGGANNIVHGSNITAHLDTNARMDVAGSSNTITALASSNLGVWGGGNTILATAGAANIWIGGNTATGQGNTVVAGSNDAIYDNGVNTIVKIGVPVGQLSIAATGSSITVDLIGHAEYYQTPKAAYAALSSDGHGGSLLSLGAYGSIDFTGMQPHSLSASNFKIG